MDLSKKFAEEDIEQFRKFLNMINEKMSFDAGLKMPDVVNMYKELAWIQATLIPKMEANILEVKPRESETKEDKDKRAAAKSSKAGKK